MVCTLDRYDYNSYYIIKLETKINYLLKLDLFFVAKLFNVKSKLMSNVLNI